MVMPRSRSRSMESSTWASISRSLKPPQIWMKRSARVDLPWSMWAMIEKLRIRLRSLTAGFFQRWFAGHGGDRGVPPKTARKCTRFRRDTPSVPVWTRHRSHGPHRRSQRLFGQAEGDEAGASLTNDAHGDGSIDRQFPGDLLEVRNRLDRTVVQIGDHVAGTQADHRAGTSPDLAYRHPVIQVQGLFLLGSQLDYRQTQTIIRGRGCVGGRRARRSQGIVVGQRTDFNGQLLSLAATHDLHGGSGTRAQTTHRMRQIRGHHDVLVIELEDHVPNLKPTLVARTIRHDLRHQRTGRTGQTEGLSKVLVDLLNHYTQPATAHRTITLELFDHIHGHIHRNGKGQPHETTRAGKDLRVDA